MDVIFLVLLCPTGSCTAGLSLCYAPDVSKRTRPGKGFVLAWQQYSIWQLAHLLSPAVTNTLPYGGFISNPQSEHNEARRCSFSSSVIFSGLLNNRGISIYSSFMLASHSPNPHHQKPPHPQPHGHPPGQNYSANSSGNTGPATPGNRCPSRHRAASR